MSIETKVSLESETVEALQDLIQVNLDSQHGFQEAAEQVNDAPLSKLFREMAVQRGENAEELQRYVRLNGEPARVEGSFAAAFHRTWLDMRSLLNGGDAHVILCEAERGEDQIKHAYEDVLKKTAASAMNDVISQQYVKVKHGHDKIRSLRDRSKTTQP